MKHTTFALLLTCLAVFSTACDFGDTWCESNETAMVKIANSATGYDFMIDACEASRSNATAETAGNGITLACSYASTVPWTNVTFEDAINACLDANKHLCTKSEWLAACSAGGDYPYGNDFAKGKCNDSGVLQLSGQNQSCKTPQGVYDMSGNASEWVQDDSFNGSAWIMGGSFNSESSELSCGGSAKQVKDPSRISITGSMGFRCCGDVGTGLL